MIAEGTVVSRFEGGLTAVRLNDDFVEAPYAAEEPVKDGVLQKLGETNKATSSRSPSGTGDMQGKEVRLPDGTKGVVVAHRPPVLFVYSGGGGSAAPDGTSSSSAEVLDTMASVAVYLDEDAEEEGEEEGRATAGKERQEQHRRAGRQ